MFFEPNSAAIHHDENIRRQRFPLPFTTAISQPLHCVMEVIAVLLV